MSNSIDNRTAVDRLRALFNNPNPEPEYEPISSSSSIHEDDVRRPVLVLPDQAETEPFSWFEYGIFMLIGVAMLWAWYVPRASRESAEADISTGTCF